MRLAFADEMVAGPELALSNVGAEVLPLAIRNFGKGAEHSAQRIRRVGSRSSDHTHFTTGEWTAFQRVGKILRWRSHDASAYRRQGSATAQTR